MVYHDMDDAVTAPLPMLCFDTEYHLPDVEDYVVVLHMTTGLEAGIVLGKFWTKKRKPASFGEDLYRKDFSNTPGVAYMERDPETQATIAHSDFDTSITFGKSLLVTAADDITASSGASMSLAAAGELTLSAAAGSVTVAQILDYMRRVDRLRSDLDAHIAAGGD